MISYEPNKGVGFATRIGLKKAVASKPDVIVFLDGDGQLDPKYIPEFVRKLSEGYDYVYGLRYFDNYPLSRKIGNYGLTFLTNLLCPSGILDTECGYKALTIKAARKLRLKAERYERDIEFAYEACRNNFKIGYVRIKVPVFHPKPAAVRGLKNFVFLLKRRFAN